VAVIIAVLTGFRDFGILLGRLLVLLGGRTLEAEEGPPITLLILIVFRMVETRNPAIGTEF
jgi:hypothetical protein